MNSEIVWRPYRAEMLAHHSLTCQVPFRTLLAPLFCYNFVENHTPHVVAKQFKVFDAVEDLSLVGNFLGPIKTKENRGPEGTNYLKVYEQKLNLWEEKTLGGFKSEPDLTDASMDEVLLMLSPNHNAGSSGEDSHVPNNNSFREDSPGPNNTFREDSPGRNYFRSPGPSKEADPSPRQPDPSPSRSARIPSPQTDRIPSPHPSPRSPRSDPSSSEHREEGSSSEHYEKVVKKPTKKRGCVSPCTELGPMTIKTPPYSTLWKARRNKN